MNSFIKYFNVNGQDTMNFDFAAWHARRFGSTLEQSPDYIKYLSTETKNSAANKLITKVCV